MTDDIALKAIMAAVQERLQPMMGSDYEATFDATWEEAEPHIRATVQDALAYASMDGGADALRLVADELTDWDGPNGIAWGYIKAAVQAEDEAATLREKLEVR